MAQRLLSEGGDIDRGAFTSLSSLCKEEARGSEGNGEVTEEDTEHPEHISHATSRELRKRFLDRLAEVIAYRKGGAHVASTALIESVDSVSIYMAKNDGFDEVDKDKLPILLSTMSEIRRGSHKDCSDDFWTLLVEYYKDRLEQDYIPNYRTRFEALHDNFRKPSDISWEEVEAIQVHSEVEIKITKSNYLECMGASFDALKDLFRIAKESSIPEQLQLIARRAYEMRHSRPIKTYIQVCLGLSGMRKFLSSIYFLGRIRAAYETFMTCAKAFPSFTSVQAYLLLPPKVPTLESAPTLADTMRLSALDYDLPTIRRHVNSTIQLRALQEKFLDRQEDALKNLRVHAEIQILQIIQQTVEDLNDVSPYFGCSKLSCYLCSLVLKAYNFETRGCHGRLYERWTVLHQSSLLDYASPRPYLSTVMGVTQNRIIEILQMPLGPMKPRVAESSAGYTIEANPGVRPADSLEAYERWLKTYEVNYLSSHASNMERALRKVRRKCISSGREEKRPLQESPENRPSESIGVTPAAACGRPEACHKDTIHNFAGKFEREAMISQTFHDSSGRPLDSADYLVSACRDIHIPAESSTCDDFGFSNVYTANERSRLLVLYTLLIDSDVVNWDSRRLLDLRRQNLLAESIKSICSASSQDPVLRACSLWFLKNQHGADASSACLDSSAIVSEGFRRAWSHIGLGDASNQSIVETVSTKWSKIRSEAFLLYTFVLLGNPHSVATDDIGIDFGFCACPDALSGEYLLHVYRVLIDSCSFEEFCSSFESRQLFGLLQKYVWNEDARRKSRLTHRDNIEEVEFSFYEPNIYDSNYQKKIIPHLQTVLEKGSTECDAVWRLKQFVLSERTLPWSSVITQYGFFNCRNALERFQLKEVYKKLLVGSCAVDPMDLQSASARNEIYDFACGVIPLHAKFEKLMRNMNENGEEKYILVRVTLPKKLRDAGQC